MKAFLFFKIFFFKIIIFYFFFFLNLCINLLFLTNSIFYIAIFCIFYHKTNFLITLLFIELSYSCIFFSYIIIALIFENINGFFLSFTLLILIACESVIGLGILLNLYKNDYTIKQEDFTNLKG